MLREKRNAVQTPAAPVVEAPVSESKAAETVIAEDSLFEGNLNLSTLLRVEGNFKGDINSNNRVVVGSKGSIIGNVTASSIYISGSINGHIKIEGKTEFSNTGKLEGELLTGTLVVEEGAKFDITCKTSDPKSADVKSIDPKSVQSEKRPLVKVPEPEQTK